jgi:hypothetical protein
MFILHHINALLNLCSLSTGMTVDVRSDDNENEDDGGADDSNKCSVLCEFKSTHNLPLPMSAVDVCRAYNDAFKSVLQEEERGGIANNAWSRVRHPIGQLLGYMVDSDKRHGILSSGTRSYFLRIIQNGQGKETVQISDAVFVGQKNYLKAWVYIHQLGKNAGNNGHIDKESLRWEAATPTPTQSSSSDDSDETSQDGDEDYMDNAGKKRSKHSGGDQSSQPRKHASVGHSPNGAGGTLAGDASYLPFVPFSEIKIIQPLGYGRNGAVFLTDWQGQKVALKQFDTDKSMGAFERELQSYQTVRSAWGRLVPTPLFVSKSWSGNTRFLALQVGRRPRKGDDLSHWRDIFKQLEREYGLRHEDSWSDGNLIFIPYGEDQERLVAIDLEDVTIRPIRPRNEPL